MPQHPKVAALAARKAKHDADFERDIDGVIAAYDDLDRQKALAVASLHKQVEQRKADLEAATSSVTDLSNLAVGNETDQKKT
jgi:hypothetical protein